MVVKRVSIRVRRAIQESSQSVRALARLHGLSPSTVHKWKKRPNAYGHRPGPQRSRSRVLSVGEEQLISIFRSQTLLPLDDCFYALNLAIPKITRSSMHRCFQRCGLTPLKTLMATIPHPESLKASTSGVFHLSVIRIEVGDEVGMMFMALDRVTKFAYATFVCGDTAAAFNIFLEEFIRAVPYTVRDVSYIDLHHRLPENGSLPHHDKQPQKATLIHVIKNTSREKAGPSSGNPKMSAINFLCQRIAGLPLIKQPYQGSNEFRKIIEDVTNRYNRTRKLKSLGGHTPLEYVTMLGR